MVVKGEWGWLGGGSRGVVVVVVRVWGVIVVVDWWWCGRMIVCVWGVGCVWREVVVVVWGGEKVEAWLIGIVVITPKTYSSVRSKVSYL